MKNKNIFIGISVLFLIILVVGGYYVLSAQKKPASIEPEVTQQEVIPTIMPDELGLILMARSDKKAIKFEITNISGITSVDYEINYLAKGSIPRGAIGHVEVKSDQNKISTNYIELGSCSSGKCKYDEGVTSVKLLLKITKSDGKVFQAEKSLEL
ncbi:MAG: hypothetical protein Q7R53_02915 [bacterium]|nr:hypothetical protein [bacterium]